MHGDAACITVEKQGDTQREEVTGDSVRITVSLPQPLYDGVMSVAKRDDRSLAFIVRKAVEGFLKQERENPSINNPGRA